MNIQLIDYFIKEGQVSVELETGISLMIHDEVFSPGTVRVHLPAPINASWLREGQLLDSEPMFRMVSVEDYPQRSVYFNEILTANRAFSVDYAFSSVHTLMKPNMELVDMTAQKSFSVEQVNKFLGSHHCGCESYTMLPLDAVRIQDVCEEKGLPYLKEYRAFLSSIDENNPLIRREHGHNGSMVRDIYRFIITHFNQMHRTDHNIAFVSMCRMCGIPARWQGGWGTMGEDLKTDAALHDWAMVHLLPYGWINVDCSFGAEAFDKGLSASGMDLTDYFFGNIDPGMVPTASAPMGDLYPAKDYERADHVFNAYGEVELVPGKMSPEEHFEGYGLKKGDYDSKIYLHPKSR